MDPQDVYDRLCTGLCDTQLPLDQLLSLASDEDIRQEVERMKQLRGTSTGLTEFEAANAKAYNKILAAKGEPFEQHVYALNQNPKMLLKAAHHGILPALTATDKYLWVPSKGGPLLPLQKFAAHGFPVTEQLAEELKTPAAKHQRIKTFSLYLGSL